MKKVLVIAIIAFAVAIISYFFFVTGNCEKPAITDNRGNFSKPPSPNDPLLNQTKPADSGNKEQPVKAVAEPLPKKVTELLSALKTAVADNDWETARDICVKLASMPAAFDILAEILLDNSSTEENDTNLRWRAALILGRMGDKRAIAVFEQALPSENARNVRSTIVLALGMFKGPAASTLLEAVYLNENEEKEIRESAADYLAQIPGGIDALLESLNSSKDKQIRLIAVKGLAFCSNEQDFFRACQTLSQLLDNTGEETILRREAAKSLGNINDANAAVLLMTSLNNDSNFRIRNACAEALGNFENNPAVVSALTDALHYDKDPTVRGCAAKALESVYGSQASAALTEALANEQHRVVRVRIVESLGEIGGDEINNLLTELAEKDPSIHVREAAKKALDKEK